MTSKKHWLVWTYCECGCHCLTTSVGNRHYAAYIFLTHDQRGGQVRVFDGGCGRVQKAVKADFREAVRAGLVLQAGMR